MYYYNKFGGQWMLVNEYTTKDIIFSFHNTLLLICSCVFESLIREFARLRNEKYIIEISISLELRVKAYYYTYIN